MKIAVNLLPFREEIAGVGRFTKNILQELAEIDNRNQYFLFCTKNSRRYFKAEKENFNYIICGFNSNKILSRILWEQLILPFQLFLRNIDILFTPSVAIPTLFRGRKITVIHDIAYVKNKNKYPPGRRIYLSAATKVAFKLSKTILTVSEFTEREIRAYFKDEDKRITVIYNGVSKAFFENSSIETKNSIKEKYKLPKKFLLYVGAIEPGKNIEIIIEAFVDFLMKTGQQIKLVLTGGLGWQKENILKLLDKYSIKEEVVILPYLTDEELPYIYNSALILLYLSAYEGFGLPVLEGMASGVPVIASNVPPIQEFAHDAAFLVNPFDKEKLVKIIQNIIMYSNTERNEIITKGRERARKFTWSKSARTILSLFNEEANSKS